MPKILPLAHAPHHLSLVARRIHDEWDAYEKRSLDQIEQQLKNNLNIDRAPMTWVTLEQDRFAATASLDLTDLPGYDHLSPWLASVFVESGCRGRGLGKQLIAHVKSEAGRFGFRDLYLWTPGQESLYQSLGWRQVADGKAAGRPVTIMSCRLAGPCYSIGESQ